MLCVERRCCLVLVATYRCTRHRRVLALFAALRTNETLTSLQLGSTRVRGLDAAVMLAAALCSNATLRSLDISNLGLEQEYMQLVLGALGGSDRRPSRCGVAALNISGNSLDISACAALGRSLARGAPLEDLKMDGCGVSPDGAERILAGLVAGGRASRLRKLHLHQDPIGLEGACRPLFIVFPSEPCKGLLCSSATRLRRQHS